MDKTELSQSLADEPTKNSFIDKITDYVLKKTGTENTPKVNTNYIMSSIVDASIPLDKNEGILKHIIYDACKYHDQNLKEPSHTFRDAMRQAVSETLQFARSPTLNLYLNKIEPSPEQKTSLVTLPKNKNVDEFTNDFNKNLVDQMKKNNAEWLHQNNYPYYTQDPFTNKVYHDANQISLLLNNSRLGYPYINYAPVNIIIENKKSWLKELFKQKQESPWCSVVYKGKDKQGIKTYEMTIPTKKLTQDVIPDNPMTQQPVNGIALNQDTQPNPQNIEEYLKTTIANYLNAALTKTPYYPPQWSPNQVNDLASAIEQDPLMGLRASKNAFSQATSQVLSPSLQMQNQITADVINDIPEIKNNFLSTVASIYADSQKIPEGERPQFVRYMDHVAHETASPITAQNLIPRLENVMQHPAVSSDMISSYQKNRAVNTEPTQQTVKETPINKQSSEQARTDSIYNSFSRNPQVKNHIISTLANAYFDAQQKPEAERPLFVKQMDAIEKKLNTTYTNKNINEQLEAFINHPASRHSLIQGYLDKVDEINVKNHLKSNTQTPQKTTAGIRR
jgi:hypothetical protein